MNRLSTFTPGLLAMKKKYLRRKLSFQLPGNFCMDQTQTVFGLSLYKCTTTITPWQFTFFSPVIRKKTTMPLSTPASVVNPAISHPSQKVLCATETCYQVTQAPLEELITCHPWNHLKVCVIRGLPYPTRTWTFCPALPSDRKNKRRRVV